MSSCPLGSWVAICVVVLAGCDHDAETIARWQAAKTPQERAGPSEELVERYKAQQLRPEHKQDLQTVLLSKLGAAPAGQQRSRASHYGVASGELRLAWLMALDESNNRELIEQLLKLLDSPWASYERGHPFPLQLHGDLLHPPSGLVAQRIIRLTSVDGEAVTEGPAFEFFQSVSRRGVSSATWGWDFPLLLNPSHSITIEAETRWYRLPADLISHLPSLANDPPQNEAFHQALAASSSDAFAITVQKAQFTADRSWRADFE